MSAALGSGDFLRALMRAGRHGEDRAALLAAAVATAGDDAPRGLARTWFSASTDEQVLILRTLAVLPQPERFTDIARDACRSSMTPLFEAVALDNAYAAAWFDEHAFNQMVLKVLSLGCDLRRVAGLAGRVTPSLRRAVLDFHAERIAAGRAVPADIVLILGR